MEFIKNENVIPIVHRSGSQQTGITQGQQLSGPSPGNGGIRVGRSSGVAWAASARGEPRIAPPNPWTISTPWVPSTSYGYMVKC